MFKLKVAAPIVSALVAISLAFSPTVALATNSATKISTTTYPVGIFLDNAGNVFIADNPGTRLVVYPHGTNTVSLFGQSFTGSVESTFTLPGGSAAPKGVALDPISGALFYTEFSGKVWAISHQPVTLFGTAISQQQVDTFVHIATVPGGRGSIAFDPQGNLFLTGEDIGNIQVLPRTSNVFGNAFTVNVPGPLPQSQQFANEGDFLADVAFDKAGNLYVSAMFGSGAGVHVLTKSATTLFGHAVNNQTFTLLTGGSGISNPCGIDIDKAGRVYIGDWGQNKVYELSSQTENVFDVPLTANVASSIPSFDGLANQGIAVRPDGSVLYSGALDGTYQLVNSSDAWVNAGASSSTLANTGKDVLPIAILGLIMALVGAVCMRATKSNN